MPDFHTKSFPNGQYRFELYANIGKEPGETIAKRKGAVAWCNLGYFDMEEWRPNEGLIIDGETISKPRWRDWGVCIGEDGGMLPDLPDSVAGKCNFCAAVPPMLKSEKDAAARKDFAENGTTYIGFKKDGTPVISICPRRLPCKGATSQQAVKELQDKECIHVLRFDGSWSSQGDLGDGVIKGEQPRTVYSMLLIYKRYGEPLDHTLRIEKTNKFDADGKFPVICLDAGHYTGCSNGNSDLDYKEDEFTLDISKRLAHILERCGFKVYQTREGDEYVGLIERSTISNGIKDVDLFVSLHSNENPNKTCDGFGIYTYGAGISEIRNKVAVSILKYAKTSGISIWGNGLFYNKSLSVLRKTVAPAILIEHGFHSNTEECKRLKSSAYREQLAEIDAKGICESLNMEWVVDTDVSELNTQSDLNEREISPLHREAVTWCKANGITDGNRQSHAVTREEVCSMLYRFQKRFQ